MKSIANPVGFTLMVGGVVTATNALTAPSGRHLIVVLGGVIATVAVAGLVALTVWVRTRARSN
jgi:hypothetical protein